MRTILKPLAVVDNEMEFPIGTKLFKKSKYDGINIYMEYKLVWANWEGPYMMLIRKLDEKTNKAEFGVIPQKLTSGKYVVNKSSFQRTLGTALEGWYLETKN
ncbi:hypothetical protein VOI54_16460 [Tamlana sp. 2201CG12-4]|uniref:hypothetical protein n=1 Tax=Tamlana sp. 2201CG12-4 TaxID=3112582 RepID=UPI002DBA78E1|nr:hypothetical protein [Tamlana sp. 2201CG12-4]MEC3908622.1 hypothetical protein [Tamlana sp. 2201CG12-4]